MTGFFDRIIGRKKEISSASTAKNRLQFILVHDRIDLPPERLKAMKEEILAVISKYVSVSSQDVEIALEQRDRKGSMLVAEIPFSKSIPPSKIDDTDDEEKSSTVKDKNIKKEASAKSEDDSENDDLESTTKSEEKKKDDDKDTKKK